jgi:hypothetical protein
MDVLHGFYLCMRLVNLEIGRKMYFVGYGGATALKRQVFRVEWQVAKFSNTSSKPFKYL